MKAKITLLAAALLVMGCNSKEAEEKAKNTPGYAEAQRFCTQCHKLPFGDQHPPTAWPAVILRMEQHMESAKRKLPSEEEHAAIVGFFQKTSQ
ncbi:MAG: hypothetical protein ACOY3V_01705 [Pseudomonadota bacterium]